MTVFAHCAMSIFPTGVEPVNVNLRTIGLEVSSAPISVVLPATTFRTPAGIPASAARAAMANADKGVSLAGFATTVQPDARAGASFLANIAVGKFQGVIEATTPTGCLMHTIRVSGDGPGIVSPYTRFDSSENHSMKLAPYAISPRASDNGLPCSVVRMSARSS